MFTCIKCSREIEEFGNVHQKICKKCIKTSARERKKQEDPNYYLRQRLKQQKRGKVLERDKYRCKLCKKQSSRWGEAVYVVYKNRLDGQPDKPTLLSQVSLNNLFTLCRSCYNKKVRVNRRLENAWSVQFEKCLQCGGTDRRYGGKGLCIHCYQKQRYVPTKRTPKPLKPQPVIGWSKAHACCTECGQSNRKHAGMGLCTNCYMRHRYQLVSHPEAKAWSRDYTNCIVCERTDRRYAGKGLCVHCYYKRRWKTQNK
jgi:hypothetical protein